MFAGCIEPIVCEYVGSAAKGSARDVGCLDSSRNGVLSRGVDLYRGPGLRDDLSGGVELGGAVILYTAGWLAGLDGWTAYEMIMMIMRMWSLFSRRIN